MNEASRICDAKVGHGTIRDLTGVSKVVNLTGCDVAEVRQPETSINFE